MWATPFEYLDHLVVVPVTVGRTETRFVFDSGIGLTLLAESLATGLGCEPNGRTFTGRRMSGQAVTTPLATVDSLAFGTERREQSEVGLFDTSVFPGFDEIGGFLSLEFFEGVSVTVDYPAGVVVVEDDESLAARVAAGTSLPVHLERTGLAIDVHLPFDIPGHASLSLEVDMGSDSLILDERFAASAGIDLEADGIRRVEGEDETGHTYRRTFTVLPGSVHPAGAPALAQTDPEVMFQQIIHDGLVGKDYLRNYAVTFDLPNARMILA